jgi:putative membrane protein
MISGYSDHSANERTFLAWVRTGIAVIAFGFVIEKFNLFVETVASSVAGGEIHHRFHLEGLPGLIGRYGGLAFILGGAALVVVATIRFVRITRMLDDAQEHSAKSVRAELIVSAGLLLLVASYSLFLVLT